MHSSRTFWFYHSWILASALGGLVLPNASRGDEARSARFSSGAFSEHVRYLAGDELAGRGVGKPGIEKAAEYIAERFAASGLEPGGEDGTFFQSFNMTLRKRVGDKCSLAWTPGESQLLAKRDFAVLPFSSPDRFDASLAFVGYGVSAPEYDYDDYARFDATGKALLMLRYEPKARTENDFEGDDKTSDHALFSTKAKLAKEKGAAAILIVNPPSGHGQEDRLYSPQRGGGRKDFGIPMIHITRAVAEQMLESGGCPSIADLQARIDQDRASQTRDLNVVRVTGDPGIIRESATTRNVIGRVPGAGTLADEYVVIGAHYDHLGRTALQFPDSKRTYDPNGEYIHHGADDNASGTAGLIELAKALAAGNGPRRSVLFIAFSGEESGLLGSEHYVDHPTVPLDKIVAMLNMDMIGRLRKDKLTVYGVDTSPEFKELVKVHSEAGGFDLSTVASGFGPSDHTSFYRKKIPVLHFFSGLHKDYHRPSDTADRINSQGAVRILEMVRSVAEMLGSSPNPPGYVKTKIAGDGKRRSHLKVRMGIMPSYADDDEDGMFVSGIVEDGPADRAGVQDDDCILWIGPTQVNDIYDYMQALEAYEAGDEVVVKVLRDGDIVSIQIKLEGSSR